MTDQRVRANLRVFRTPVEMPGGYTFDHVRTLKLRELYLNSIFEKGQYDSAGFRKYFYNIVKPACDVAQKFIDIDTAHYLLVSNLPDDELPMLIYRQDFRLWIKETDHASLLNEICEEFPRGHVVTKRIGDGSYKRVNLHNLRMEPSVDRLENSGFVYELLEMSPRDIRSMKAWDQEQATKLFEQYPGESAYVVYECYDVNTEPEGKKWKRTFKAELLRVKTDNSTVRRKETLLAESGEYLPSIELYSDEVDELPYQEEKWEDVPGRWLGRGFPEYLTDNQIRRNEISNAKAKSLHFKSISLFQSQDETVAQNILKDVENGDILHVKSPITEIPIQERNLSFFQLEAEDWDRNSEMKTFTTDVTRGASQTSGTTLGSVQIAAGMAGSYFELKREKLGIFLKKIIERDVLPSFKKQSKIDHVVRFFGDEQGVERLYQAAAKAHVREMVVERFFEHGVAPTADEVGKLAAEVTEKLRKRKSFFTDVRAGFYDDIEEKLDVVITGEQLDVGSRAQTVSHALSLIGANPALITDTMLRSVFFKLLELAGISPAELNLADNQVRDISAAAPPAPPGMPPGMAGMGGEMPMRPGAVPPAPASKPGMMMSARSM